MSVQEPVRPIEPLVRMRECRLPTCDTWYETPHGGDWAAAFCSRQCERESKRPVPPRRTGLVTAPRQPRARRTISPASPAQRDKLNGASIVSGATAGLDPAHLAARARGGCDDPLCVVPLTRQEHRAFDTGKLDLLPYLLRAGCVAEIQHALGHYHGNMPALLARLTGTRWVPTGQPITPGGD